MAKVLLIRNVSSRFKHGGIRKHCQELFDLFKNNQSVSILPVVNIPNRLLPVINKSIFKWPSLYESIKESKCDIVHIHGFATLDIIQSFIVARILHKRIVYSPHYHPFQYLQHPIFGKIYFYCLLRFFLRFATAIITITNNDTEFFTRYHKHVYRIPHYFDRDRVGLEMVVKKKNMILFVGRNEDNKGLFHLYRLDSRYEVHLVTNGEVKRKDFIIHTNITNEDLERLYKQASLVVIPSRYEAFSYVALEAFANGTPVVMSNTVMIADYLKGIRGFSSFDFGDESSFLKAVDQTIGTTVDTGKILAIFSKFQVKKLYEEVYLNAMNQ